MKPLPLPVVTPSGKTALTPAQQRFNALVRDVAQTRDLLATWQGAVETFRSAYAKRVAPLDAQLDAQRRQWAFALDALSRQSGWSRVELETMSALIGDLAFGQLLGAPDDAPLRALFAEHAGIDFDEALRRTRRQTVDEDDHAAWQAPPRPRRSAADRRRAAEAKLATQSVREVYRKLASALHPDREPDPAQHAVKTTLMQQANQAHAAGDLLALLELQWQVAQLDVEGLASSGTQRLKQYNAVLTEQLASLKASVADVEQSFRRAYGLSPDLPLHPAKLEAVVRALRAEVQEAVTAAKRDRAQLADPGWVRAWLKHERKGR